MQFWSLGGSLEVGEIQFCGLSLMNGNGQLHMDKFGELVHKM